jgi:hypothetical protein
MVGKAYTEGEVLAIDEASCWENVCPQALQAQHPRSW